ncbi:MAG: hypothetical protein M0P26_08350 [Bacteroidales bacterium]|nr:hypothetical protein [Bacteroidales bacterium]
MKKLVLSILIIFSTFDMFAQMEKGDIIISVSGNYIKTTTEDGGYTNQNATQGKYLNFSPSIGTLTKDNTIAGLGLDYYWTKEKRFNSIRFNGFLQNEVMNAKSKVILPYFYIGYYYHIISKLYLNANFKMGCGVIKSEMNTDYVGTREYDGSSDLTSFDFETYVNGAESSSDYDYFCTNIYPEITYFVSTRLGLCLGIGGIEYSMIDWKKDNSSWIVNFNPNYWKFGIKVKL